MIGSAFKNNVAQKGGAVYIKATRAVTISGCNFTDNLARGWGSDFFGSGSHMAVDQMSEWQVHTTVFEGLSTLPGRSVSISQSSGAGCLSVKSPCARGYQCSYANFSLWCSRCQQNTVSVDGVECRTCEAGLGAAANNQMCLPCRNNTYSSFGVCLSCPAGADPNKKATACIPCEAGKFKGTAAASCSECRDYNVPSKATGSISCQRCRGGTESSQCKDASAGIGCRICKICTNFSVSAEGANYCTRCGLGKHPNEGLTQCVSCPASEYFSISRQRCTACAENQIPSPAGWSCVCDTGFYNSSNGPNIQCFAGIFDDINSASIQSSTEALNNAQPCRKCPACARCIAHTQPRLAPHYSVAPVHSKLPFARTPLVAFKCHPPAVCLGELDTNISAQQSCAVGHFGPLFSAGIPHAGDEV